MSMGRILAGLAIVAAFGMAPAVMASSVQAGETVSYPANSLKAIAAPLQGRLALGRAELTPDSLTITALKGSDYYTPQDGSAATLSAPLVLFPVQGDFIFSARVTMALGANFDGAALMVYADDTHWGKLLLERSQPGMDGVTSTIVAPRGDDAYHVMLAPGQQAIYLKITRQGDMLAFYTSNDGQAWTIARDFTLDTTLPVMAGFEAQSPLGDKATARFDQVRFEGRTPSDFWHGE